MNIKRIAATLIAGIAGGLAWQYTHKPVRHIFDTAPVQRGNLQSLVTATGSVNPLLTVGVGTQVSGVVTKLYADFESRVHKGQVLAEIDPRPFQDAVQLAQASLDSAQANLTASEATVRADGQAIVAARDDSSHYKALVGVFTKAEQYAKLELDHEIALGDITSVDEHDTVRETHNLAADDVQQAQGQVEVSDLTVAEKVAERDAAVAEVEAAKDQVSQARGALEQAKINLEHTRILSPIDGTVLALEVQAGQTVAASAQVPELFQIAQDLSKIRVDVNLDESDVSRVAVGDPTTFTVDAFPGTTFQASVHEIRKEATNVSNVVSYDVVLNVAHTSAALLPGMTTNIHILSAERDNVLKIPNAALRFRPLSTPALLGAARPGGTATVYVLDASGNPAERRIVTGITDTRETEVRSGDLKPGDAVVIEERLAS
jgi:HlyD family secretion protein